MRRRFRLLHSCLLPPASCLVVLALALLIRLPFAAIDFAPTNDLETYRRWAHATQTLGLVNIYTLGGSEVDYPPLILYWLAGAAWLADHLPLGWGGDSALNTLIKLPSILADVLTAGLIAWALRGRSARLALGAAGAYLFNPAIWYVSTYWGQTDALYALFLVASVIARDRGAAPLAWSGYALAFGTKLQSLALAPLLGFWTLTRHGLRRLGGGLGVAVATLALLAAPWLLAGRFGDVIKGYTTRPSGGPPLVVSGYNFWYLVFGGAIHTLNHQVYLPKIPITYQAVGVGLFLANCALVLLLARRMRHAALPAAALILGLFLFLPYVRERYLFPVLAFLLLAVATRPRLWGAYALLSATGLFNLLTVASPFGFNLIAATADTPPIVLLKGLSLLAAAINLGVLGWLLWELRQNREVGVSSSATAPVETGPAPLLAPDS